MQVQIDQDRSILLPFAPSPIIDSQVANGERRGHWRRFLPNAAQYRVITGYDGQPGGKSLAGQAARYVADQPYDFCRAIGLATIDSCHLGQPLAEDFARTQPVAATEPTGSDPQLHRHALPRKLLQTTAIAAMPRAGHLTAEGTRWFLLDVDHQSESLRVSFDAVQYQNARVGKKGL